MYNTVCLSAHIFVNVDSIQGFIRDAYTSLDLCGGAVMFLTTFLQNQLERYAIS
jgi:hypothetical protein